MKKMVLFLTNAVLLPLGLLGCQVELGPAPLTQAASSATSLTSVSISVSTLQPERKVQATASDVESVMIRVLGQGRREFSRTLDRAALSAGTTSVTFNELLAGWTILSATALDADGRTLGAVTREVELTTGSAQTVDMPIHLEPTLAQGGPAGGLVTNVSLAGFVTGTVTTYQVPTHTLTVINLLVGPTGTPWLVGQGGVGLPLDTAAGAFGTLFSADSSFRLQAMDAGGHWWGYDGNGTVKKFSPSGSTLQTVTGYREVRFVGADDRVWAARDLYTTRASLVKLDPAGQPAVTLSHVNNRFEMAPATGELWEIPMLEGALIKRYSGTGQLLAEFPMPEGMTADAHLTFDNGGDMWVIVNRRVIEIAKDGTVSGFYAAGASPRALAVDKAGNLWVFTQSRAEHNVTKLSPTGAILGTQSLSFRPHTAKADPAGNIWVLGDQLAKIVP